MKAIIGARKVILNETAQTNNSNESVLVKLSIIILKAENVMVKSIVGFDPDYGVAINFFKLQGLNRK